MSDKTPNNIEPKLKDIGYFRTTDRTYEETLKYSNIDNEYIQLLEQDAKVVEMGSGLHQKFANGLKLQRPDITVISIDPSLGVDLNEEFISLTEKKGDEVNAIHYYEKNPNLILNILIVSNKLKQQKITESKLLKKLEM